MRMKILFQGDSVTDAGRDYSDMHNLGSGYPRYAAMGLIEAFPTGDFDFINLGVSGNQIPDLINRLDRDFIDIQPDIVSILIGVNDVWSRVEHENWYTAEEFEGNYRTVLDALKTRTKAKIVMISPFFIREGDSPFRMDLNRKIAIVKKLADEYADIYIPLDDIIMSKFDPEKPNMFSEDSVHPNEACAELIGKVYADAVKPLILSLR